MPGGFEVTMSLSVDQAIRKANRLAKKGEGQLAEQIYKGVLERFPGNKRAIAGLRSLKNPQADKDSQVDQLISLYNQGQFPEVLTRGKTLAEGYPKAFDIYNILGAANMAMGALEEAVANYTRALQIKPDYAVAHNNLGVVLKDLGKHDEAIARYTKALEINPDYTDAHGNLGKVFKDIGKYEEAMESFTQALSLAPDRKDYWQSFSETFRSVSFGAYNRQLAGTLLSLLAQPTVVHPTDIAGSVINFLKLHPQIKQIIKTFSAGDIEKTVQESCNILSNIQLFLRIIELCPIPDLDIETLLKSLRRNVLLNIEKLSDKQSILRFQISLALHCFTNEFLFDETRLEKSSIEALALEIKTSITNKEAPDPSKICCLASYRPLHRYQWSHSLVVSEALKALFKRQVSEVLQEESIRGRIPCLKDIEDDISLAVRDQYETNPYPRWINTLLHHKPLTISEVVKKLDLRLINEHHSFSDRPDILIAGCGTGRHSLDTASRFLNSKVQAVDLSLSSLGYAIRKTKELGIANIEYMQADIIDLCLMNRQFDVVESGGVLHHMAEPMAGWKVLTDCLKPGGLMKIGLYSELARQHVVKARQKISEMELLNVRDDILKFRKEVIKSDDKNISMIVEEVDFFSTSTLRDLLFHVQEHRFTIHQIQSSLKTLGLTFAGFELVSDETKKMFKQYYPESEAVYDLDLWHEFEISNPSIFRGMYQFWLQKSV